MTVRAPMMREPNAVLRESRESDRRENPHDVETGEIGLQRIDIGLGRNDARNENAGDHDPAQQAP